MVKKSVVWTETAIRQRREILLYWTLRNKSTAYAEKLISETNDRIQLISKHPEAGKPTNHGNTREAAMGNFSIYYQIIDKQKIIITSFWDNRQDPEKLLQFINKT